MKPHALPHIDFQIWDRVASTASALVRIDGVAFVLGLVLVHTYGDPRLATPPVMQFAWRLRPAAGGPSWGVVWDDPVRTGVKTIERLGGRTSQRRYRYEALRALARACVFRRQVVDLRSWQKERIAEEPGPRFLGMPDRWFEPHALYRCTQGHVSRTILKSERHGDRCLACHQPVVLTFNEDRDGVPCAHCYCKGTALVWLLDGEEKQRRTCVPCRGRRYLPLPEVAAARQATGLWLPLGQAEPGTKQQYDRGERQLGRTAW